MTRKKAWGEDRVYFYDAADRLRHAPVGWTSEAPVDVFTELACGRCFFRPEDLLRLATLVDSLKKLLRP